jgi:hypothetical protein
MSDVTAIPQEQLQTTLSITNVTGTDISFAFNGLAGNQPSTYGNTVYLWQTPSNAVPRNTTPQKQTISVNSPTGTGDFGGLTVTDNAYVLGYAVGNGVANVCATWFIPSISSGTPPSIPGTAGGASPPWIAFSVLGTTSVSFNYGMPPGMTPQADGDWVGIWAGMDQSSLYGTPPTAFVPVGSNTFGGSGAINNVPIMRGTLYTLGYFKGGYDATTPKQTSLACTTAINS